MTVLSGARTSLFKSQFVVSPSCADKYIFLHSLSPENNGCFQDGLVRSDNSLIILKLTVEDEAQADDKAGDHDIAGHIAVGKE